MSGGREHNNHGGGLERVGESWRDYQKERTDGDALWGLYLHSCQIYKRQKRNAYIKLDFSYQFLQKKII